MLIITDDEDFDINNAQLPDTNEEGCMSPTSPSYLGYGQNRYENTSKLKQDKTNFVGFDFSAKKPKKTR
jgi:hypothetical protein